MKNDEAIGQEMMRLKKVGAIQPFESLHTEKCWKMRGYVVKDGENPISCIPLWISNGETYKKRYTKLYSSSQVKKV